MAGYRARGALATLALSSVVLVAVVLAGMLSMAPIGDTGSWSGVGDERRRGDSYEVVGGVVIPPSEASESADPFVDPADRDDIIVVGDPTNPLDRIDGGLIGIGVPRAEGPPGPADGPGAGGPIVGGPGPGPGPAGPVDGPDGPEGPPNPVVDPKPSEPPVDPDPSPDPDPNPSEAPSVSPEPPPDRVAGGDRPPVVYHGQGSPWPAKFTGAKHAKHGRAVGKEARASAKKARKGGTKGNKGNPKAEGRNGQHKAPRVIIVGRGKPDGKAKKGNGPRWRPKSPARQTHPRDSSKWSRVAPRSKQPGKRRDSDARAGNSGGSHRPAAARAQRRRTPTAHRVPAPSRVVPHRPKHVSQSGGKRPRGENNGNTASGRSHGKSHGKSRGKGHGRRK